MLSNESDIRQLGRSHKNARGVNLSPAMSKLAFHMFSNFTDSFKEPSGVIPNDSQINPPIGPLMVAAKFVLDAKMAYIDDSN